MNEMDFKSVDDQLNFIRQAQDLRQVNSLLTKVMARQAIQPLIKGDNLDAICNAVVDLAIIGEGDENESRLIGAAILGRLSAVARTRQESVFGRLSELLPESPLAIDNLVDGDEKYYAALSIAQVNSGWVAEYCLEQSVLIDTAEKARRVLVAKALSASEDLSTFWQKSLRCLAPLKDIAGDDTRYKRIRRITATVSEVVRSWESDVGVDAGLALGDWAAALLITSNKGTESETLVDVLDDLIAMLLRIIELRFSFALLSPTYALLEKSRTGMGSSRWSELLKISRNIEKIRMCLKEAALVLARQGTTDKSVMDVLATAYYSRSQVMPAITAHFSDAHELDPGIREWWEKAGSKSSGMREADHKIGNSEDQQIGTLLINVEDSKSVMEKLGRAVVPLLEISDPVLAETVKKAEGSYTAIATATRQLAAMRKLENMGLKGAELEYNPLQQDMLGGHKLGVRAVKVERDGIKKDFGGKVKVLVKPRVVPID